MRIGDIIKQYREGHGQSQRDIAKRLGCSYAYISMLENDKNPSTGKPISPSIEFFKHVADMTGMTIDELLEKLEGTQPVTIPAQSQGVRVPVLGRIAAGIPLEAIEDIEDYEEIPAAWTNGGQEYFGLKVKGGSMEPLIHDGSTVIVRKQEDCENGQIAAILVGDEATVKKVKFTHDGIMLIAINAAEYEPHIYPREEVELLPVRILGIVVEARSRIHF